jgi:hypothetical protein
MTQQSDSAKAGVAADTLAKIGVEADLFHTADGNPYADIRVNGHRETWPVRSRGFRRWLGKRFFEITRSAPNAAAVGAALNLFEARAQFEGPVRAVHIRVAGTGERLYLDLIDEAWRCVEIDAEGWRIVQSPPVRFRRSAGMLPLPVPASEGDVEELRRFINLRSEADHIMVVAWLLAALRDKGPYPLLVLAGEQGSAKTTLASMLRALVDPNVAPLRALPRDERDLFIAANNGHLLAFDNVSGLPYWLSDALCRIATGGGFATRQLYTDTDEVLFDAARPIVLNGIEDIITRPDLADRAIFLSLDPIRDGQRKTERELWKAFRERFPAILGGLLDAAVAGLRVLPSVRLSKLPRMADFAHWVTACEGALWEPGEFDRAYRRNRERAVDDVIAGDPVADAVRRLMVLMTRWEGTATDLLELLAKNGLQASPESGWPASPRALAARLRRAATFLRAIGIDVGFRRSGRERSRVFTLTRALHSSV